MLNLGEFFEDVMDLRDQPIRVLKIKSKAIKIKNKGLEVLPIYKIFLEEDDDDIKSYEDFVEHSSGELVNILLVNEPTISLHNLY